MSREALLARTFVELADNLVDDFDVVELASLLVDRCMEVTSAASVGLMLASPDGDLRVLASSSEVVRLLEDFEADSDGDPASTAIAVAGPSSAWISRLRTALGRTSLHAPPPPGFFPCNPCRCACEAARSAP